MDKYVVMAEADWNKLQEIVRRHPAVLQELIDANLTITRMDVNDQHFFIPPDVEAPRPDDGEVK